MKLFCAKALCLLFFAACQPTTSTLTAEQRDVVAAEVEEKFEHLAAAAKALDHERYFSFFDPSEFSILNANGTTSNDFEAFKKTYQPQMEALKEYNYLLFDPVNINVIDMNSAIVVNEYQAEVVLMSGEVIKASGAGAQFWTKKSGDWKLVHVSDASKITSLLGQGD